MKIRYRTTFDQNVAGIPAEKQRVRFPDIIPDNYPVYPRGYTVLSQGDVDLPEDSKLSEIIKVISGKTEIQEGKKNIQTYL